MRVKKFIVEKLLNLTQKLVKKLYEIEGNSDKVLDYQIRINEYRYKNNLPDKSYADDEGYVQ